MTDPRSEIEALLSRMAEATAHLAHALTRERAALHDLDVAALETTSRTKLQALTALEQCEQARVRACARFGVAHDSRGMLGLLAGLGNPEALIQRWTELTATLAACRIENRATGVKLGLNKRRVSEALSLLRGDGPESGLYGPDGCARQGPSGAPLASA